MKKQIAFISDSHNKHDEITKDLPGGWMLLCGGDISMGGSSIEILDFLNWFSNLPYEHKIFIAGNHDWLFEKNHDIAPEFKEKGVHYLFDNVIEIEGLKIYGSPWQPRFYNWAFNVDRYEAIAEKWKLIPNDIDILITHGPPFGILDGTWNATRAGCEELYKKVVEIKPKIHLFGHIHYGAGIKDYNETLFINASCLGERYTYINKPIVIDYDFNLRTYDIISH